jgi:hypothetical protein
VTDSPAIDTSTARGDWQYAYRNPLDSYLLLLVMVSLTILLLGLVDLTGESLASLLVTALVGAMLTVALRTSNAPQRLVVAAAVLATLTVVVHSVAQLAGIDMPLRWLVLTWFLLTVVTPGFVLARVLRHPKVTLQTIFGVVCVYLLSAITATFAFILISSFGAEPFFSEPEPTTSFMYFSLVTISTLGYGDLAPNGDFGRMVAAFEAVLGQVFLVTVVARLVSLYAGVGPIRRRHRASSDSADE